MTRRVIAAVILLLANVSTAALAAADDSSSPADGFLPELTESNSPVCEHVVADVRRWYARGANRYRGHGAGPFPGMKSAYANQSGELIWAAEPRSDLVPMHLPHDGEVILAGNKIRFGLYIHSGCGGACERYQVLAWTGDRSYAEVRYDDELVQRSPPESLNPQLYQGEDGNYYAVALEKTFSGRAAVHAYQLQADASWTRSCYIPVEPEAVTVLPELLALEQATLEVMKGGGSMCGSMRTRSRWAAELHEALQLAMYHPKSLQEVAAGRSEYVDEFGLFAKDMEGLALWGLMNIADQALFQQLQQVIGATKVALAVFYQKQYEWSQTEAEALAKAAVEGAVSRAIRFYEYKPIDTSAERELRAAILAQEPIEKLKQLSLPKLQMKGFGTPQDRSWFDDSHGETLLNIAVAYPVALQWLLEQGADADWPNEFGKTPLMYAVQQNQLESVRLLLEHGADPAAETVQPSDQCYYALSSSGVTALHYAARYASAEVIRVLLEAGARSHQKTRPGYGSAETARDWLNRYASGPERNPHLLPTEIEALQVALTPADTDSMLATVDPNVALAERLYQRGEVIKAYRLLNDALSLVPDHPRALRNQIVVGWRAGRSGAALKAAERLLKTTSDEKIRAEVEFNQASICADLAIHSLYYDGSYHCQQGWPSLLTSSLSRERMPARVNKLVALIEADEASCQSSYRGVSISVLLDARAGKQQGSYRLSSLYVTHPSEQKIVPADFGWADAPEPTIKQVFAGGAQTVTELELAMPPRIPHAPLRLADRICPAKTRQAIALPCLTAQTCLTAEQALKALTLQLQNAPAPPARRSIRGRN